MACVLIHIETSSIDLLSWSCRVLMSEYLMLDYLGEKSIHKLAKRYEVPHSCIFPTKLRRKKFSSSDLPKCPELKMFSHILDTSEMAECSKKFQECFKGPWNFLTQLKTFSDETCNIAMTAICRYIEFCYEIQDEILRLQKPIVQPKDDELIYSHPFSKGTIGHNGFMFKLWKILCMPPKTLYGLHNEFTGASVACTSKKEAKWVQYIVATHSPECADKISATYESARGQRRLRKGSPDAYCNVCKTAYFFHGCYTHRYVSDFQVPVLFRSYLL
jgi:hypothetical protein